MAAEEQDLFMEQGADWVLPFTNININGTPVNLTGSSFRMQLRSKAGNPTVYLDLNTPDEIVIVDAPGGDFTITVPHTVTSTLTRKTYAYDLFWEDASGRVRKLLKGVVENDLQVTNPSTI